MQLSSQVLTLPENTPRCSSSSSVPTSTSTVVTELDTWDTAAALQSYNMLGPRVQIMSCPGVRGAPAATHCVFSHIYAVASLLLRNSCGRVHNSITVKSRNTTATELVCQHCVGRFWLKTGSHHEDSKRVHFLLTRCYCLPEWRSCSNLTKFSLTPLSAQTPTKIHFILNSNSQWNEGTKSAA